jgi:hypothetical protein
MEKACDQTYPEENRTEASRSFYSLWGLFYKRKKVV